MRLKRNLFMFATISRFSNPVKGEQKEVFSVRSWDEIAEILSRYADKTDRSSLFLGFFSEEERFNIGYIRRKQSEQEDAGNCRTRSKVC